MPFKETNNLREAVVKTICGLSMEGNYKKMNGLLDI